MGVVETGMDAAMAEGKADGGFNTDDQGTNNNMGTNPSLVAGVTDMIAEGSADDSFNNTDGCDTDDNMGATTWVQTLGQWVLVVARAEMPLGGRSGCWRAPRSTLVLLQLVVPLLSGSLHVE
jgi:hypothetical protein